MTLSKRSIETLVDLVEIKLSCIQIVDRDDARERGGSHFARRKIWRITRRGR